ncbi:MAG: tetratricopeptide repeat protein [Ignavibacteria bacterium]
MAKKNSNILNLYPGPKKSEIKLLKELDKLMLSGNFLMLIEESEKAIARFPKNRVLYTMKAIAHSQLRQIEEALSTLRLAEEIFPNDREILFELARTYKDAFDFENAEKYFKMSYQLTPKGFKDARSDCLSELGELYWEYNCGEEALEYWKEALKENPKNRKAKENLENRSNRYGEPETSDKLLNDMHHFRLIQTQKYFKSKKIDMFTDIYETNQIIWIINAGWNNHVAPEKEKLDTLSVAEINKWFKSIKLDFTT